MAASRVSTHTGRRPAGEAPAPVVGPGVDGPDGGDPEPVGDDVGPRGGHERLSFPHTEEDPPLDHHRVEEALGQLGLPPVPVELA